MRTVTPVILSGGSGTRLWPLSRGLHPKQFMNINGQTLFGDTVIRALALPKVAAPIVICNEAHRFLAAAILQEKTAQAHFSRKPHILLEPQGRNTAPAVALCAMSALSNKAEPAGSAAGLPNNIRKCGSAAARAQFRSPH